MDADEPDALSPQPHAVWSAETCPRFQQATCRRLTELRAQFVHGPLDVGLPDRQVGQAIKAVTSHRTPGFAIDAEYRDVVAPLVTHIKELAVGSKLKLRG